MSLIHHLITTRTPHDLAKELAAMARENAALLDRAGAAETELFWMKVAERNAEDGPGQDEASREVKTHYERRNFEGEV